MWGRTFGILSIRGVLRIVSSLSNIFKLNYKFYFPVDLQMGSSLYGLPVTISKYFVAMYLAESNVNADFTDLFGQWEKTCQVKIPEMQIQIQILSLKAYVQKYVTPCMECDFF